MSASIEYLDIVPLDRQVDLVDPAITYPFELDNFQKLAQYYIQKGENVLITAHTSAGKTVVAESGIAYAKKLGKRAFYTSPIKTLSNQKYSEFSKKFGDVGLMTGDIKCNPDAQCLIMTTEILRDMLAKGNNIDDLQCVIFDEVHYVNDRDRGHVWEKCLIGLPPNVVLILLSASISEAGKFARWIANSKKRPIHLITTLKRPVPLNHYAYINDQLHLIFDEKGIFSDINYNNYVEGFKQLSKKPSFNPVNLLNPFINFLKIKKLTPAIFFVLSKKNCQVFADRVSGSLVDGKEQSKILNEISRYLSKSTLNRDTIDKIPQIIEAKRLLSYGIGVHHSDVLPIIKEITEMLFSQGLIKVLFATETFAVGVNMPTRTVIFTQLTKYCDGLDQPRFLIPSEYLQMAGRAGRRGLDQFGTVIHLPINEMYNLSDVRQMVLGKSARIESKFKVNYSFILQTIAKNTNLNANKDDNSVKNITNQSYLYQQQNETIDKIVIEYQKAQTKYDKINQEISELNLSEILNNSISQLIKLESSLLVRGGFNNVFITLDKKQEKKIKTKIDDLLNQITDQLPINLLPIKDQFLLRRQYENELKEIDSNLIDQKKIIDSRYAQCIDELNYLKYIADDGKLTQKGIIASHIVSANEILITELISEGLLDNLDGPSIAAILSLFCADAKHSDKLSKQKSVLPSDTCEVINWVYQVADDCMVECPIYADEFRDKGLSDTLTNIAYLWANGATYFEVMPYFETFEGGNFIRNMLRLSHLCDEIIKVAEVCQLAVLEKKLIDLKGHLIRDIVTPDSLYLRM